MEYLQDVTEPWKMTELAAFQMYDLYPEHFLKPNKSVPIGDGAMMHSYAETATPLTRLDDGYDFVSQMLHIWKLLRDHGWQPTASRWSDIGIKDGKYCVMRPNGYQRIKGQFKAPSSTLISCTSSFSGELMRPVPKYKYSENSRINQAVGKLLSPHITSNSHRILLLAEKDYAFIGRHSENLDTLIKHFGSYESQA